MEFNSSNNIEYTDEFKGQAVVVFVVLKPKIIGTEALKTDIKQYVRQHKGPIYTPDIIEFVNQLPKTQSGKVKRKELGERAINL